MDLKLDDLKNGKKALAHLLMESKEVAETVSKSPEWTVEDKENRNVAVTVQFNGIECPAEVLESLLAGWYDAMNKQFVKKYADQEAEIKKRVEDDLKIIVSERVDPYVEKLEIAMKGLELLPYCSKSEWEGML